MTCQRGSGIGQFAEIALEIGIAFTLGDFLWLGNIGAANEFILQVQNLRQVDQLGSLAEILDVLNVLSQVFGFFLVGVKPKDNLGVRRDSEKSRLGDIVLNYVEDNHLARKDQFRLLFESID